MHLCKHVAVSFLVAGVQCCAAADLHSKSVFHQAITAGVAMNLLCENSGHTVWCLFQNLHCKNLNGQSKNETQGFTRQLPFVLLLVLCFLLFGSWVLRFLILL